MKKIKLLYDVFMNLRDQEIFNGTVKVDGRKNKENIFNADIKFEKNMTTGQVKTDVKVESNCEKKFKHESKTEFNCNDGCHTSHHSFMKKLHSKNSNDKNCFKDKMGKISMLLGVLYNIKMDELSDGKVLLTFDMKDIPKNLKECMHKNMNEKCIDKKHKIFEHLHKMENHNGNVKILVNANKEVDKVTIELTGSNNLDKSKCNVEFNGDT